MTLAGAPLTRHDVARLASVRVALVVTGVVAIVTSLAPVFAVLGLERALVFGLIQPPFVAAAAARIVIAASSRPNAEAGPVLARVLEVAVVLTLIPFIVGAVSGWVHGACDPLAGVIFMVLGPGLAVPVTAVLATLVAALALGRGRAGWVTLAALLVPVGAILFGLLRFVTTPAIFAYAHTVGFFPGSLYDPDVQVTSPYLALRVGSIALVLAASATFLVTYEGRGARLVRLTRSPWVAGLVATLTAGVLTTEAWGAELGLFSTRDSIRRALGGHIEGAQCDVVYPRELPYDSAVVLRDECDFRIDQAERILGVTQRARVTAFFFRDAEEKQRLMGASNTYIAKPWRNEVYLQVGEFPHPVLFHELVHVVAANVGIGPFRIAGGLGGLLPSPGIVEGTAVAVAWEEREGLTPHQWARALVELGHAPSIASTEGLGFLLEPASRAYTVNGSFVRFLLETRGAGALRRLYRTASYEEAFGMPLEDAERAWREFLRTVTLPPHAMALAELRFERPAVFAQVCPHAVANLEEALGDALDANDPAGALAHADAILRLDPGRAAIRAVRCGTLARLGRADEAESELSRLRGPPSAGTAVLVRAREGMADAAFRRGDFGAARRLYRANAEVPQSESARRQLEVKLAALDMSPAGRSAIAELLLPEPNQTHDGATQIAALSALEGADSTGLASYLLARQMLFRLRFDLADEPVTRALDRGLPGSLLRREARRMRATVLAMRGDFAAARLAWAGIRFEAIATPGDDARAVEASDWLERVDWLERRR